MLSHHVKFGSDRSTSFGMHRGRTEIFISKKGGQTDGHLIISLLIYRRLLISVSILKKYFNGIVLSLGNFFSKIIFI